MRNKDVIAKWVAVAVECVAAMQRARFLLFTTLLL